MNNKFIMNWSKYAVAKTVGTYRELRVLTLLIMLGRRENYSRA